MKKRIVSMLLALALALPLAPAARAAGVFADVTDSETAIDVAVLALMGVIEGDGYGSFRPNSSLTRAEFCKMMVEVLTAPESIVKHDFRAVFPDVPVSHWASSYVNWATASESRSADGEKSSKTPYGASIMHGYPDGTFKPQNDISYGEAITILMRALGYTDADSGRVWPDGYLALAKATEMDRGVALGADEAITRAQAAKLFVNALESGKLGGERYTLSEETTLLAIDVVNYAMRTTDKDYSMEKPREFPELYGLKGYVLCKDGKALTFVPSKSVTGSVAADAAIIVAANGSTAGFDALTGKASNYTVYRNGVRSSTGALKQYDVVTYDARTNTLQACDTRVTAYYESCDPSPAAPLTIKTLGGTTFSVLPTAQSNLAAFKPGDQFVLQLTADGRIAGAVPEDTRGAKSNAFAFVTGGGETCLICGGSLVTLKCPGTGYAGRAVRIAQDADGKVFLSAQSDNASGALELASRMLGTRKLAGSVLVFSDGRQTSLEGLGVTRVDPNRVVYARVNAAGEVDMLVLSDTSKTIYYGRAIVKSVYETDSNGKQSVIAHDIMVDGNGHDSPMLRTGHVVKDEEFVEARVNGSGTQFTSLDPLTKLAGVSASAWIGDTAVNVAGKTYVVYPETVLCWNADSKVWLSTNASAENLVVTARAYGGTMNLYAIDGVVRVIEVGGAKR